MPLFCRHNRFEASCPICSREKAPAPRARKEAPGGRSSSPQQRRPTGMVTRRLARTAEDGYRNELVPGVKSTADAERLATALAIGAARIEFPGPQPDVVEAADPRATAFAAAVGDDPALVEAFRRWTPPVDGPGWTPQRRFARWYDRLRLPGLTRAQRFEFLVALGAAAIEALDADALHLDVKANDATALAAKRALNSGDAMLLERRAAALAEATDVPLAALDRGLALWDGTDPLDATALAPVRRALRL